MIAQKGRIKVLVILGPTSSGKSDLAVYLARKYNGEIISADSRQVYKGLNIGTGKITKREMRSIQHHLLDVANPKTRFTAAGFVRRGRKVIGDIASRGKLPIIAGGTMFYIDALLGDVQIPEVPPDEDLRAKLERRGLASLLQELQKLDPKRAKTVEKYNKRRIIRAIEIALAHNGAGQAKNMDIGCPSFDVLKIGIKVEKKVLRERIKLRTAGRMRAGMVAEARKLHEKGLSYKRMRNLGLEYGHLADYLQNKITPTSHKATKGTAKEELIWRIERDDWRYAKKQMAWWKRDKSIKWYSPTSISSTDLDALHF